LLVGLADTLLESLVCTIEEKIVKNDHLEWGMLYCKLVIGSFPTRGSQGGSKEPKEIKGIRRKTSRVKKKEQGIRESELTAQFTC